MTDDIAALEARWHEAARKEGPKSWAAENAAWDAMETAKRAAGMCIEPGCRSAGFDADGRCSEHPVFP
jgi:hypothetical protein